MSVLFVPQEFFAIGQIWKPKMNMNWYENLKHKATGVLYAWRAYRYGPWSDHIALDKKLFPWMKGKAPWIILLHTATLLELFHCTQAGYVPPASDERIFMNKRQHWIIPLHMLCYVTSASNIYVYEQKATLLQFFHCLRCCCTPSLSVSSSAKRRANWWNWFAVGVLAMILRCNCFAVGALAMISAP